MSDASKEVAPFRMETFCDYEEFEQYLRASDTLRGSRWLYERSLASKADKIVLSGTCGLCLTPTRFTASTKGGEPAPSGRVPNWREGLACGCEHRLISRERALLHYILAAGLLRPWTRILGLGDVNSMRPVLAALSEHVDCRPGPFDDVHASNIPVRERYHLIISSEQLTARSARRDLLVRLGEWLTPGGTAVFTAPFDINPFDPSVAGEMVGWGVLGALAESGFETTKMCLYWSEELGYLGAFNLIISAYKD